MAKLGGEQTELLQVSADERARAARTALLFSEEDLTRNLQIVLRTFDDLNYRQEQRFHLELGLMKLIYARRLLPLEELLSGVMAGAGVRTSGQASRTGSTARSPSAPSAAGSAAQSAPASPFEHASGVHTASPRMEAGAGMRASGAVVKEMPRPAPEPHAAPVAAPFPASPVQGVTFAEPATEGALAKLPEPAAEQTAVNADSIRQAVVTALAAAGHASASQLLSVAVWMPEASTVRIEVAGMSKKMLGLTVNAAAEKIIRQELQRLGAPPRFMVVPGEGAAQGASVLAVPQADSVDEAALAHPLVQRAREIFKAEVRSVVDLRVK